VEVRICDGQTELADTLAVAALAMACIARFCADADAGRPLPVHRRGLIEENLWRAQRHGLEGELIDLDRGETRPTAQAVTELLEGSAEHHAALGLGAFLARIPTMLAEGNGAVRQRRLMAETGGDLRAVHAAAVRRTRESAHEVLATLPAAAPSAV
jgi:carboxylate-amine ligase